MWNPFRAKPLLSEEDQHFQVECYRWLLTHFGGDDFYREARLVLPTREFFPTAVDSPQLAARTTFEQVKRYAGMQDWDCRLEAQDQDPNPVVAPTIAVQNIEHNPLGTFSADNNNQVTITYNPKLLANPEQMVATFAHELSHYLTATAPEPPPGGWENWEFATDICVTFLGFGVFNANSAFSFQQFSGVDSQGWQTSGGGYLSQAEHSYALALFLLLKDIPPEQARPHCSANIQGLLKKAVAEIERGPIVQTLRDVDYVPRVD